MQLLAFSIALLMACQSSDVEPIVQDSKSPPIFNRLPNNPVLMTGNENAWDAHTVFLPEVLKEGSTYYLYYTASANVLTTPLSVGVATSSDGKSWTKRGDSPLLQGDGQGYNALSIGDTRILKDGRKWIMYFNTREYPGPGPGPFIGRATANTPDGPWIMGEEAVLTIGKESTWDAGFVSPSDILKVNGKYYLYYSGGTAYIPAFGYHNVHQLGLAISDDGIHFDKYDDPNSHSTLFADSDPVIFAGAEGSYDSGMAWEASILPTSFGFEMFYTADPDVWTGERVCYATSEDGIKWTKDVSNPIYQNLSVGGIDLVVGSVLRENDTYTMYYSELFDPITAHIFIAEGVKQ